MQVSQPRCRYGRGVRRESVAATAIELQGGYAFARRDFRAFPATKLAPPDRADRTAFAIKSRR